MKLSITLLFALFAISACKKESEPTLSSPTKQTVFKLPADLLSYTYFLPGTYWVYKNATSGETDSIYVFQSSLQMEDTYTDTSFTKIAFSKEKLTMLLKSSTGFDYQFYSKIYHYPVWNNTPDSSPYMINIARRAPGAGNHFKYQFYLRHPLYNNRELPLGSSNVRTGEQQITLGQNQTIQINGITFSDVLTQKNIFDAIYDCDTATYKIAKNIGLVEYALSTGDIWQLERYHIVQP